MGVAAGTAQLMVALLARKLHARESIAPEGWAVSFGILGAVLTFLSGLMTVIWPLNVNPPINIMFDEPTLLAAGPMLAPFALRNLDGRAARTVVWCMAASGAAFLLFSLMNYYTHIGLLVNMLQKASFKM